MTSPLRRIGAATMAFAVGTVLVLTTSSGAVAAETPATAGLTYVALGDSYAAGFGLTPITGSPVPGCEQATEDYPHQVAAALGMSLTDVTCTGAVTANIIDTEQVTEPYFDGGGTAQPQSTALSADVDVVTVSIGGNDTGFTEIATDCVALTANGPVFGTDPSNPFTAASCEAAFAAAGPAYDFATKVSTTVRDSLRATYSKITELAPNAKVFVVGYPSLLPDAANTPAAGCFTPIEDGNGDKTQNAVPYTDSDVPFIRSIEVLLNQVIAEEAAAAGFTYIDNQTPTVDHSACPQSGEPYVNGITLSATFPLSEPYTVNGGLHPNAAGVGFLAAQTTAAVAAAFPAAPPAPPVPGPSPTGAPVLPATGGTDATTAPALWGAGIAFLLGTVLLVAGSTRTRRTRA